MQEYEKPFYEMAKGPKDVVLGQPFFPFENGVLFESDPEIDEESIADSGYSATFNLVGFGKGRIELYQDMTNIIPAENIASNDISRYVGYDVIPVKPIPVIYFNNPKETNPYLTCFLDTGSDSFRSDNNVIDESDDMAMFNEWTNEKTEQPGYIGVVSKEKLSDMQIIFELTDAIDTDYYIDEGIDFDDHGITPEE